VHLAHRAASEGRYHDAHRDIEQALLFDAEDHLAWWSQAVLARLMGSDEEEAGVLLNAHYLAPLEPALRAESFLSQSAMMGKEPSSILRPLAESPEQFVEVACLLLDMGLYDQATRWIDEALRHGDLAMLRYLQAFAYLSASRMSVDAAEQVAAAGRLPFGPPLPWRDIEGVALRFLRDRFSADSTLASYLELYERFGGSPK
jgi:tetratricopeptide (TPR) repeat protein